MAIRSLERQGSDFGSNTPKQAGDEETGFSAGDPKEMASQAMEQAREKAAQAADSAKEVVRGQIESRTNQAGGQISSVAEDLRKAAETLRAEGSQSFLADFAERAAGTVEQAAGYLENADLENIMEDLKRAGRQRPVAVAGGLFALGFAASRLIKVSTDKDGE